MNTTPALTHHLDTCLRCEACKQLAQYYRDSLREARRDAEARHALDDAERGRLSLQCEDERFWRQIWRGVASCLMLAMAGGLIWAWIGNGRIW